MGQDRTRAVGPDLCEDAKIVDPSNVPRNTRLPSDALRGSPDGPFEGPAANVVNLFLHGPGQWHGSDGHADEIVLGEFAIGQPRLGDRRYHALLDFSAGPASRKLRELLDMKLRLVDAAPLQVDLEDLDLLFLAGQIDEKYFVEPPFADHFCGQKVDAVGGGGDEKPARFLLHPGKEEREDTALLAA
jgi:hypothetical protein